MHDYDLIRLKHIRDASEEILSLTNNKSKEILYNDRVLNLAIVRLLEIVGEASSKVSKEVRDKYSNLPWNAVAGMRNRLIHGYYDIDLEIVWKTVIDNIPTLLKHVIAIIETEHPNENHP